MKKILLVALLGLFMMGCKKQADPTFCWQCTMYKLNSAGYLDFTNPIKSEQCDKTEVEIRSYEKDNTKTIKVNNGTNEQTKTTQSMNCTK